MQFNVAIADESQLLTCDIPLKCVWMLDDTPPKKKKIETFGPLDKSEHQNERFKKGDIAP